MHYLTTGLYPNFPSVAGSEAPRYYFDDDNDYNYDYYDHYFALPRRQTPLGSSFILAIANTLMILPFQSLSPYPASSHEPLLDFASMPTVLLA
jgi:hypothetical protein